MLVSASDKVHNATAILLDFRVIGDEVWTRFNRDAGKSGVVGYYRGLVHAYRETGFHSRLIDELDRVVSTLEDETGVRAVWPPGPHA